MKKIVLTKGFYAIVDDDDYENLNKFNWTVRGVQFNKPYAVTGREQQQMANFIIDVPDGLVADHIDGNSLDNRKSNLRLLTNKQNQQYKASWKQDGFKGVSLNRDGVRYTARIFCNGKRKYIGLFDTEQEAADAYDKKALELFGDWAYLNRNKYLYVNPMSFYDPTLDRKNGYIKIHWSDEIIKKLKDNYGLLSNKKLSILLGMDAISIKTIADKLGIKRANPYYNRDTGEEYSSLKDVNKKMGWNKSLPELYISIMEYKDFEIKSRKIKINPDVVAVKNSNGRFSDTQIDFIRVNYGLLSIHEMAKYLGCHPTGIKSLICRYKISKNNPYINTITGKEYKNLSEAFTDCQYDKGLPYFHHRVNFLKNHYIKRKEPIIYAG